MTMKELPPRGLVGENTLLSDTVLGRYTDVGMGNFLENTRLGDYSYTGPHCIIQNAQIGRFSNIAALVRIGPTNHPMDRPAQHHFTYRRTLYGFDSADDGDFFQWRRDRVARIGHDTWLGHGAILMSGVSLGVGAVIGSGSVVTKDVPDYAVAVGNPARVIRYRFPEEVREALKRIAWWDWSHEEIKKAIMDFTGPVEKFIEKYEGRRRGK